MAQTRYVTDELVITFRTGPGTTNSVTRNLRSGDRVEILDDAAQDGYVLVRLPDGDEGWVLVQYLQDELTGDQIAESVRNDLLAEQGRSEDLAQRLENLSAEFEATSAALDATQTSEEQLNAELTDIRSASQSALATRARNEELADRVESLDAQVEVAQGEIERLSSRERQNWFLTGSAVLAAGIVIGLVAPLLRRRRRSSW